jgi:hypothetical protein
MSNINSYNSKTISSPRDFLVPTRLHFFLYFLLSVLILTFTNGHRIWEYFSSNVIQNTNLGALISDRFPAVHNLLSKISQGRALQILFWIFVGTTLYTIFWFLRNVLNNLRNDVVASEYIHPKDYSSQSYWRSIILRKILFGFTSLILLAFIYAAIKLCLALGSLCHSAITSFHLGHSLLQIVFAVALVTLVLHILVVLCKVVVHAWQFIYVDL